MVGPLSKCMVQPMKSLIIQGFFNGMNHECIDLINSITVFVKNQL